MSLRFILGNVGCGKTSLCINEIIEKDNFDNKLIYIVPEQFSMESERALLKKKKSIINTGVYSFRHLAFVVMQGLGISGSNILDDIGKAMLLQKSLIDVKENLNLYKSSINKRGFTDSLSSTISELMQYNVYPENIADAYKDLPECALKYKLMDIEKIYISYNNSLKTKYISAESTLEILTASISKSSMFNSCEIWIDGFKSFTPQELNVIEELLKYTKRVNIALNVDTNSLNYAGTDLSDIFYETKNTIKKLNEIAFKNNIPIDKNTVLNKALRYGNNIEMSTLSSQYLNQTIVYNQPCEYINICQAKNKYDEIEYVCSKIIELIRDKHYSYSEIAVISADSSYESALCSTLNYYGIPNFLDSRRDISTHPLTQAIISALEIISTDFSINSVFDFLKSPFVDIDKEDVFLFENYCLAQNMRGKGRYNSEWKYGFDSTLYTQPLIEDIRDIFLEIISPLADNVKGSKKYTVSHITNAVFKLLESLDIAKTLNTLIEAANSSDNKSDSIIHNQIWDHICSVFQKMSEFLGNDYVNINQYINILKVGLDSSAMGIIPSLCDYLIVGDLERTRLPEIKALFILGANEGIMPPQRTEAGIFSDSERVSLKYRYFNLAPELQLRLAQDKLNIYMAITKPSQYLYITYSTGNIDGSSYIKSPVIEKIESIFTELKEYVYDPLNADVSAQRPALNKLIQGISSSSITEEYAAMYRYFNKSDDYRNMLDNIKNILKNSSTEYLPIDISERLYPYDVNISVSKIEKFSKCPYSFFMEYTLNANERNEYSFKALQSGNIYHSALEYVFSNMNLSSPPEQKNDIDSLADEAIEFAVRQSHNEHLAQQPRYIGFINRMKRILALNIWNFSCGLSKDKFRPKEFEFSFNPKKGADEIKYMLDSGKALKLTGKIDRIDHMETADKIYVRIVDYKSGNSTFDLNNIYHGIDIQLPLYMNAYINYMGSNYGKELMPGEILYYKISSPQFDNIGDNIQEALQAKMQYNGIVSSDSIELNVNAQVEQAEFILSNEEFKKLGEFIDKKIMESGSKIAKGYINIKPYRYLNKSKTRCGCDMCEYKSICKIDLKEKNKYNNYTPDSEIKNKILK